ncbi:MAG: 50S ribosomal protein L16 [Candidatus Marsarchaeota archaeon]|jgi:large subunit ribosomal protein L10e|nr:50S ribosomal protein L16 [Candidatus Marsarchaeota archaeon]
MKLRPARCVRGINSQPWARYSVKKPRKNYIKALPHTSLLVFKMGTDREDYNKVMTLEADQQVQLRSNALEAARQVANKFLEGSIVNNYRFRILVYPHNVVREKKRAMGAGADRISQGMTLSFGSPSSVAARVYKNQRIFEVKLNEANKEVGRVALKRAASKLSGTYSIRMYDN